MTAITRQIVETVYCDATGCLDTIVPPFDRSAYIDRITTLLSDLGWTTWEGRRGLHHYCPNHKPRKGHNMYPIDLP